MTTQNQPDRTATLFTRNEDMGKPELYLHPDGYVVISWPGEDHHRAFSVHLYTAAQAREQAAAFTRAAELLESAPALVECSKCHLVGTPADMDPVMWSAPGTGESGTHWYCKDMTACSNRAVPGLAEQLRQVAR